MRWRVFAYVSLGVNAVLVLVALLVARHSAGTSPGGAGGQLVAAPGKTNLVVRRQFFSWQELESAEYPTYVANLRDIGCPEQTIRDIIIADVNALYSRKRATDVVTPEQQWWRSEPDSNVVALANEKMRVLDDERRTLLARLLGPNWESGDLVNLPRPMRQGITLDGPILGQLPADTKQAIEEVSLRSQERLQAYLDTQRRDGKGVDPVELARLRQQTRQELQRVLTPSQLEEFLLRYSDDADHLRAEFGELKFFNPSPDEFRAVFRASDSFDQQIALLANASDVNSVMQKKSLEDQRENAIKLALGSKRYEEYRILHDPTYRDALAAAQEAGAPEAAATIYQINVATQAEQDRIRRDASLTAEQKNIELKRIELEQLRANTVASGGDLPPEPPAPTPPPKRFIVSGPGDTLNTVSMIYGVPPSAIRAANPNVDFSKLRPGDSIVVPPSGLAPLGPTMR